MAFIDKVLGRLGLQRSRMVKRQQQYAGAVVDRLTRLVGSNLSANRSLDMDIRQLVRTSRDLVRNNGYAKRFLRMARNNVAGPKGIQMRPVNTFKNGNPNDTLNDGILAAWTRWGRRETASAHGRLTWQQLQRLAVAEWMTAGESLTQIVYDRANPFGMSLLPIDADRLDRDHNLPASPTQNLVLHGIEYDRLGRVLAYYILSQHPSDFGLNRFQRPYRDRVPAEQIIHLFTQDERVDQGRGVPALAVAMRPLSHIEDAQDATLINMKVAAANNGFITTKDPDGNAEPPEDEELYVSGEPGEYKILGPGQEIQVPEVSQPKDNAVDYTKSILRKAAAGIGTSYALLAADWSDANFGSLRVGWSDGLDDWIALQEHFIAVFCQRVYDVWLESAMLRGAVNIPDFDLSRANAVAWQGRRWPSPKPQEDVDVYERRIALGLSSRTEIVQQEGGNLWDIWDQLSEEKEYAQEMGLNVEPPGKAAGTAADAGPATVDGMDAAAADGTAPGDQPARAAARVRLIRAGGA